jgi:23S rRNA pseudouridine2605 synthase
MRINKFIAASSTISRRAADEAIARGDVLVNGSPAQPGQDVASEDKVTLNGKLLTPMEQKLFMLNKPAGYVCSRNGQGSKTIFELLPAALQHLQPVGRLDKDSSGLLLLTNDGDLADQLTHPRNQKSKIYDVTLNKPLSQTDKAAIEQGIALEDGPSKLALEPLKDAASRRWKVIMTEGRNRQIRRTFQARGYIVIQLKRLSMGPYRLSDLPEGAIREVSL